MGPHADDLPDDVDRPPEADAAEALRESEIRYRTLAELSPDATLVNLEGRIAFANPAAARLLGAASPDELIGHAPLDLIVPEHRDFARERIARILENRGTNPLAETRWRRLDGSVVDVEAAAAAIPWRGKTAIQVILRDVTERRRAEAALRESEGGFRAIADLVPDLLWRNDPAGSVTWYNQGWTDFTGLPADQALGSGWAETIHPDDRERSLRMFREAVERGEPLRMEHRIRGADGSYCWFLVQSRPVRDEAGRITQWFGAATNVHEQHTGLDAAEAARAEAEEARAALERALAELRESEERYRLIVESALDYGIFTMDADGCIDSWSPGAEAVYGRSAEEALGEDVAIIFVPEDRADDQDVKEREMARELGAAPDVRWHQRGDGMRVFIEGTTRLLTDEAGSVRGFLKIGQDVTRRRRVEEERIIAEAALRELNQTLEQRVEERTAELAEAIAALTEENEERARAEDARRQVLRQLVTAEEEERRRISRELHDSMGQLVTGLLLGLRALGAGAPEHAARIEELERLAGRIARELQHLALELRPPALDNLGLRLALQNLLEDWSERHGIEADFHAAGVEEGRRLPPEIETTLYRIVQEGLTNVLKHADATQVNLVLERRRGTVITILEDDGGGFAVDEVLASPEKAQRLGIRGMRERVALVGGEMEIESSPGSGTTLFVRIADPAAPSTGEGRG
jgi:PAS domain S-box-containing protein